MAKNKNGYGKGTFIESRYFLSPAFLSLGNPGTAPEVSCCSPQVLILFLGKRQFGTRKDRKGNKVRERSDDNKLTLTYKALESFGISQKRATRSIDELLAKGFIKIVHQGGAFDKDKSQYALTEDFQRWRPGDAPIRVRVRDVQRGYQGKTNVADVGGGHPHGPARRAPQKKTQTRAAVTPKNAKMV